VSPLVPLGLAALAWWFLASRGTPSAAAPTAPVPSPPVPPAPGGDGNGNGEPSFVPGFTAGGRYRGGW